MPDVTTVRREVNGLGLSMVYGFVKQFWVAVERHHGYQDRLHRRAALPGSQVVPLAHAERFAELGHNSTGPDWAQLTTVGERQQAGR